MSEIKHKQQNHNLHDLPYRMTIIDVNTLFIVIILIGFIISAVLTVVGRGTDTSLLFWAAGFFINSLGFVLLALRGSVPDVLSVVLANTLIVASYAFFAQGLQMFLKEQFSKLLIWAPVLVIALGFPLLAQELETRILLIGLVNTVQCLLLLMLLVQNNKRLVGRGKYILMVAFGIGIPAALSRPMAIAFGITDIISLNSPGLIQGFTFISITLINIAIALGLVLMQKEQAEAATESMARSDELTGLPNRRCIYEHINETIITCNKNRVYGALLLIDLDNFKIVNDRYGHALGDELLRQASLRIQSCMAGNEVPARLGGDEFVVLLTALTTDLDSSIKMALEKADALRLKLEQEYVLESAKEQKIRHISSGSIGVAILEPGRQNRESLLREADQAMYRVKNASKSGSMKSNSPVSNVNLLTQAD
ncbi:MAG: GGDEF domain-containing protein [Pseudohongiella sp.]|nr:GGDEF domain-containing protein [Pseudohongiella sp.]